ncbi:hypothetical protein A5724_04735 [Mycobacterium sp. ACS1612]|nr:hypothetical protein A5724_04735 [Mycobacterium sp. ACS1612]
MTVSVDGTQLIDGTVEERCSRLQGVSWEDMLTTSVARKLAAVRLTLRPVGGAQEKPAADQGA